MASISQRRVDEVAWRSYFSEPLVPPKTWEDLAGLAKEYCKSGSVTCSTPNWNYRGGLGFYAISGDLKNGSDPKPITIIGTPHELEVDSGGYAPELLMSISRAVGCNPHTLGYWPIGGTDILRDEPERVVYGAVWGCESSPLKKIPMELSQVPQVTFSPGLECLRAGHPSLRR
ncbi:MAG: hypothetical protein JW727_03175 [Candidatus Aenigmarchaeota archaeon]|nr:hypothetical protein [Candidatus Aenigmarchaeota archaeon]